MARSTMATLIAQVRTLINDPSAAVFTDDLVQESLDHTRDDFRYLDLAGAPTIASGGVVTWNDYYAMIGSVGLGDWEDDVQLLSNTFGVLSPTTLDQLVGHWTFASDTRPPVYLIGKTYDRYASAADLLKRWASQVLLQFDFATDRQSFKPSQKRDALLELSNDYLAKARPKSLQMVRSDTPQELWTRRNFDVDRTTF